MVFPLAIPGIQAKYEYVSQCDEDMVISFPSLRGMLIQLSNQHTRYGIMERSPIFKFILLILTPTSTWILSTTVSDSSRTKNFSFGQVSLLILCSGAEKISQPLHRFTAC